MRCRATIPPVHKHRNKVELQWHSDTGMFSYYSPRDIKTVGWDAPRGTPHTSPSRVGTAPAPTYTPCASDCSAGGGAASSTAPAARDTPTSVLAAWAAQRRGGQAAEADPPRISRGCTQGSSGRRGGGGAVWPGRSPCYRSSRWAWVPLVRCLGPGSESRLISGMGTWWIGDSLGSGKLSGGGQTEEEAVCEQMLKRSGFRLDYIVAASQSATVMILEIGPGMAR